MLFRLIFACFSGRCPQALNLDKLRSEGFDQSHPLPPGHAHTVTVPGAASAWVDTVSKYGSGKVCVCWSLSA